MFARGEHQRVDHRAEAKNADQVIDQEADHRNQVQRQQQNAARQHRHGRVGQRSGERAADDAPSEPRQGHGLAEQVRAQEGRADEGHRGDADHRDEQQDEQHGRQQHGHDRGQQRMPRIGLQGMYAAADAGAKQERDAGIQREKHQRQAPGPAEFAMQRQRATVEQAVVDPGSQPVDAAELPAHDALHVAVHDGVGIALQRAEHGDDVAADLRVGAEFHVAEDGHDVAAHLGVDVGISQHRHGAVLHGTGDPGIAEDRDHVAGVAVVDRGPEDRHHGIAALPGRQLRCVADADDVVSVMAMVRVPVSAGPLVLRGIVLAGGIGRQRRAGRRGRAGSRVVDDHRGRNARVRGRREQPHQRRGREPGARHYDRHGREPCIAEGGWSAR